MGPKASAKQKKCKRLQIGVSRRVSIEIEPFITALPANGPDLDKKSPTYLLTLQKPL